MARPKQQLASLPDQAEPGRRLSGCRSQSILKQGHTYLDRDGDGEACESLK
ncbi:excalibur calcium-binding domain-containing protein [Synechococcus sp. CS-1330]|nr:excalibur calcium-binding domain-containing protein [Synechococcus sp. CS-1330]